ncbi:cell division protein FtsQ [Desulforamulus reducens MI-1]|uniref:Cell division protein FtsQ n=1 Tax=Desulforamulus reducens (strain ATCC BAA-1160 / DSM 100696 / MI-1) TaxID=349161 RepID=A4J2B5_DESRM|nr:FtsQ-type POTRA domain-containing protein [Desulforamulus reducens]ABO49218.1 cell division protein FtsQ [Desulforamulus reducens MI-1]
MYRPQTGTPRKKNHLVQSVFFILLVVVASYILLQSPFFQIKTVVVNGNRQLKKEDIVRYSGINIGLNIFKVNLSECEERLGLVPFIKNVKLKRSLPNKVIIEVSERNAVALLPVENGFIKVDTEGVYLQRGQIAAALPIITGLDIQLKGPGKPIQSEYLPMALRILDQLPRSVIMKLSELNVSKAGLITLYTIDGVQGRLGSAKDLEYKGIVFQQVLATLQQSNNEIQYVDLSNPRVPVVKYFKDPQEGQK